MPLLWASIFLDRENSVYNPACFNSQIHSLNFRSVKNSKTLGVLTPSSLHRDKPPENDKDVPCRLGSCAEPRWLMRIARFVDRVPVKGVAKLVQVEMIGGMVIEQLHLNRVLGQLDCTFRASTYTSSAAYAFFFMKNHLLFPF